MCELLFERRPEQRGHVPAIEPAVLPADGHVSGVRTNQGLSHSGIRLDEGDREGPGAERHDLASIEQIADKYKRLRPFAQRRWSSAAKDAGDYRRTGPPRVVMAFTNGEIMELRRTFSLRKNLEVGCPNYPRRLSCWALLIAAIYCAHRGRDLEVAKKISSADQLLQRRNGIGSVMPLKGL